MPLPLIAAGAVLNTAGTVLTDIPIVGSLVNQHPQDPARLAYDAELFQKALNGDALALHRLGTLAGILPPDAGGGIAATVTQKNDAIAKYNQALAAGAGQPLRGAPASPGGPGALALTTAGVVAGTGLSPLVLVAGAVVLVVVLANLKG